MTVDVKLEADAVFTFGAMQGKNFVGINLDSEKGTFSTTGSQPQSGKASFAINTWHKLALTLTNDAVKASLDGVPLASSARLGASETKSIDGFYIKMELDRYVFAAVDDFRLSA